jgi:hypothetical protein
MLVADTDKPKPCSECGVLIEQGKEYCADHRYLQIDELPKEIIRDLLEALQGFVEYFEADFDQPEEYHRAVAVIVRAKEIGENR